MIKDKTLETIVRTWGILDFCYLGWYVILSVSKHKVPFYSDILSTLKLAGPPNDFPDVIYYLCINITMHLSLIVSGILLIKLRKAGAILSYIQVPFRLLTFIPPSLFFIYWPIKYFLNKPSHTLLLTLGIASFATSEILKVWTVGTWHMRASKSYNPCIQADAAEPRR